MFTQERNNNISFDVDDFDLERVAEDEEFYDSTMIGGGKKSKINLADMDYKSWRTYLEQDVETLNLLLLMLKDITPRPRRNRFFKEKSP